jgi:hypothetical protein
MSDRSTTVRPMAKQRARRHRASGARAVTVRKLTPEQLVGYTPGSSAAPGEVKPAADYKKPVIARGRSRKAERRREAVRERKAVVVSIARDEAKMRAQAERGKPATTAPSTNVRRSTLDVF